MRTDAEKIYKGAIAACLPDSAVKDALASFTLPEGKLILVSIGKAAWRMASSAVDIITDEKQGVIDRGIVITKYGHSEGDIPGLEIYEAAHPVPDIAGIEATERALELTKGLTERDVVLFLVSGGGSALFESPYCSLDELCDLTKNLLASGVDINEINAVRKHISKVKGGRFAEHVFPAKIYAVVLSDVIGNRLDTIASGPTAPDSATSDEVKRILDRYSIPVSENIDNALRYETPKSVKNAEHFVSGSVTELCAAAKSIAESLGYRSEIVSSDERGEARELGERLAELALRKIDTDEPLAYIFGGETVVKLRGEGMGGRNQETALSASIKIAGQRSIAVFSVGSDGTDGPTDAAGGYVDGESFYKMKKAGIEPALYLDNNDSYHALLACGGLIFTGPTGTNVNDVAVVLIRPRDCSI